MKKTTSCRSRASFIRAFVVVPDVALKGPLRPGEQWIFHGVLDELPGASVLETSWNLSNETVSALRDHRVYLRAIRAGRTSGV